MSQPLAYLDGKFVPAAEATVGIDDLGFLLGTTVTEQLRTFGGRIFRIENHLRRFRHSLQIVGIEISQTDGQIAEISERVVPGNHELLAAGDDLGLCIFATPGRSGPDNKGPLLCLHTFPLPFSQWAAKYEAGEMLMATSVRQVPAECWPRELKCRSRIHYYLADREAGARVPGARALLLDQEDRVLEATTANVLAYFEGEGLVTPPSSHVLPGISLAVLLELAGELGISTSERHLKLPELENADEVILSSTPFCVLPVVRLGERPIGDGRPGPIYRQLLDAFSESCGLDIAEQARRFANRELI